MAKIYDREWGGNYTVGDNGVKDCSSCTLPHKAENYAYILDKLQR